MDNANLLRIVVRNNPPVRIDNEQVVDVRLLGCFR